MQQIFINGTCASDILKFHSFIECQSTLQRLNTTWRSLIKAGYGGWENIDLLGYNVDEWQHILLKNKSRVRSITIDVVEGQGIPSLEWILTNITSAVNVRVFTRRLDGSVMWSNKWFKVFPTIESLCCNPRELNVVLQTPCDEECLRLLMLYGHRLNSIVFLRGLHESCRSDVFRSFLTAVKSGLRVMCLGRVPFDFDWNFLVKDILDMRQLAYLSAEDMNISFENIRRLRKFIKCEFDDWL